MKYETHFDSFGDVDYAQTRLWARVNKETGDVKTVYMLVKLPSGKYGLVNIETGSVSRRVSENVDDVLKTVVESEQILPFRGHVELDQF